MKTKELVVGGYQARRGHKDVSGEGVWGCGSEGQQVWVRKPRGDIDHVHSLCPQWDRLSPMDISILTQAQKLCQEGK